MFFEAFRKFCHPQKCFLRLPESSDTLENDFWGFRKVLTPSKMIFGAFGSSAALKNDF